MQLSLAKNVIAVVFAAELARFDNDQERVANLPYHLQRLLRQNLAQH